MPSTLLSVRTDEKAQAFEREWAHWVASLRIEDGRRWVLDRELELHDAVEASQLSLTQVAQQARDHFAGLR